MTTHGMQIGMQARSSLYPATHQTLQPSTELLDKRFCCITPNLIHTSSWRAMIYHVTESVIPSCLSNIVPAKQNCKIRGIRMELTG
eukprot:1162002-Rhodomonas_salina.2